MIIKDYWPTDYLDTEDVRLKEMLNDITDPLERELVERSILTPISCERVKVGDREDHTKETILRGESPNMSYKIILEEGEGEKGTFILRGPDSFIDLVAIPSSDDGTESPSSHGKTGSSSLDNSSDLSSSLGDSTKSSSSGESIKPPSLDGGAGSPSLNNNARSPSSNDNTGSSSSNDNTGSPSSNDNTGLPSSNDNTGSSSLNDNTDSPSSNNSEDASPLVVKEALPFEDNANRKSYVHRWHYRIVYKQFAIPYEDLRNLKDMTLVLEHTVQGESVS